MVELNISIPSNMLFCGKTHSGKTYTLKKIYNKYLKKKNTICFIFCSTANLSGDYKDFNYRCIETNTENFKDKIIKIYKLAKIFNDNNRNINIIIIIDDALGVFNFQDNEIINIFVAGRHVGISFIILLQQLTKYIQGCIRSNFGYYFINRLVDNSNIKAIYNISSCFNSEKETKNYILENTKNYNTIFIDNYNLESNIPVIFNSNDL